VKILRTMLSKVLVTTDNVYERLTTLTAPITLPAHSYSG
jgi:hypothetical protein